MASWASLIVETYCQYSTKVVQKRKISLEGKKKEEKKKKERKSNWKLVTWSRFRKTWERKQKLCIYSDPCCPLDWIWNLKCLFSTNYMLCIALILLFYDGYLIIFITIERCREVRKGTEQRLVLSQYQRFHTFIITAQMKNGFSPLSCLKSSCQNCSGIQKPILIQISCKSSLLEKYYNFS